MAAGAASQRTSVNILQNLRVEAGTGGIQVLGCDGEMWVQRDVACMVHETGSICLQASLLRDLVSKLPDGDVELFTLDGNGAMLKEAEAEYRLQTLDAEDFPPAPNIEGESEIKLNMGDFRAAVDAVLYAVRF
jgi:DNA polymerase-3 subunit beta